MSSPERPSRRALLLAPLLLAACGLTPAYGPGESGAALRGRVEVATPDTIDGFTLRGALQDRLGQAPSTALMLSATPVVEAVEAAVTPTGAITRYDLSGTAAWTLDGPSGRLAEGEATAFTGYSATGTTVATRSAEADARARLMALLADAILTRLLALPPQVLAPEALAGALP